MNILQSLIAFLGRVCISIIFLIAGVRILLDWQGAEQHTVAILCDWLSLTLGQVNFQRIIEEAMDKSSVLVGISAVCQIVGGFLVFLGLRVRLGAFLLLLFLLPKTFLSHHFWTLQGMEHEAHMQLFFTHLTIIGGLLILLAYGRCKCGNVKIQEKKSDK